jgi:hypothetical protein
MSRLLESQSEFRDKLLAKNPQGKLDEYSIGHPNALSDGDEKGKGENNGSIGSATDINERNRLLAKNRYNKLKEYNQERA